MWQQIRDYVLRFALACWVLGVLMLTVVLAMLLATYCTHPPVLMGYP
jgi:succinate dehydrogenase hydrophobic anchor subunit